ncbi:MAG: hypothetical protein WCL28_10700 [bacterium]
MPNWKYLACLVLYFKKAKNMNSNHNFDLMQQVYEYTQEEDYESAYKLIKPAAENGDGDFEHILGVFYRDGKFVQQSFDLAVYWLTKSASKDNSNSQVLLGQIFAFDFGGLGNIDEGIRWLTESAASDNSLACTYLGEVHAKGLKTGTPDYESAAIAFTKGSELGSIESKQKLAYYYSNGLGVTKDERKSFELNLESANGGSVDAALNLAIEYEYGRGTEKDLEQAFHWYSIAAKAGNVIAQHNLGAAYAKGSGTKVDYIEAQLWYLKAASKGSYLSQLCLGQMYEEGQGVGKDFTTALSWYFLAYGENKIPELISSINHVKNQLTTDEIDRAKEMAEEFLTRSKNAEIFDEKTQLEEIDKAIQAYENGRFEEAYAAFFMPAHSGDRIACRYMGIILKYGMGHDQNFAEAAKYFYTSSFSGDVISQHHLAELIDDGLGVEENSQLAFKYYKLAADFKYPPSLNALGVKEGLNNLRSSELLGCCFSICGTSQEIPKNFRV